MAISYLNNLNEAQRQAVINTDGPALVIAGAGAGKTRVLTYRIAYLLQKGISAGSILALTFTNKAAAEMKERIAGIAGPEVSRFLWMGTFHSIFARILRKEGSRLGYKQNYTIYDTTDSKSLIRSIIKELSLDDNIYKPGIIASRISAAKNNLITSSMYAADSSMTDYDKSARMPLLSEIYRIYASRCFKANAMDFDDLLLNINILFRDFPEVLSAYQERFKYILVDEYQDTNYAQYLIVNKLAAVHHNLCVVGDDAQSIYSFRGARIENILGFRNDYADYRLFKLEQNYRSTQIIVNAANELIEKNSGQIRKKVFSNNEPGEKICLFRSMTDIEEGINIASDIFDRRYSLKLKWSDFAILYRTNAQSRIFEETLRKKNIPYRIYGGLSFYDRKEIKDLLAYFRMIINPEDEEAIKRSINYPKRGIGDTTLAKILELTSMEDTSVWDILCRINNYPEKFNKGTALKLAGYTEMIKALSVNKDTTDAYAKAGEIAAASGIVRELRNGNLPEEISRYENIQELLNAIKIFTEAAETNGEPSNLEAYMANVALLTDQDTDTEKDSDKVTLMTMHSAKGLEFQYVYIVGMEDTLFPSPKSTGCSKDLEEERRLFYVALTRSKKHATLSYALNRYIWGNLESSHPSRFLREINPEFIDNRQPAKKTGPSFKTDQFKPRPFREETFNYKPSSKLKKLTRTENTVSSANESSDPSEFREGDKVYHERFGTGVIVSIEGNKPNTTATIEFANNNRKKLLLRFAKLNKV